jgi:pyrrolysyl-tRNA synthetase-like protein
LACCPWKTNQALRKENDMEEKFTTAQNKRLTELNGNPGDTSRTFDSVEERNMAFKELEFKLVKDNKAKLARLLHDTHKPLIIQIEEAMTAWLTGIDFTRVTTPVLITAEMLAKMTITEDHPLTEQVFWVDRKHCMRPMLAPNLYEVMRNLYAVTNQPVRIFEIGSCFRKESQGAKHMNEFTMLNLVELAGVKDGEQMARLEALAHGAMEAVGINHYKIEVEKSEVYGETLDIVADGMELASGAYGPHPLDPQWGIFDPWVGIGLGLERIAMLKGEYQTIKRAGKSIAYLDGVPLKL